jgi:transposase
MARAYSIDLRERVVASVSSGRTCRATAALFGVSVASVVKWAQRFRATGSAAARKPGGRRPSPLPAQRDWLLARIAEQGVTLQLLVKELGERGVRTSYGAVWRFLHREGLSFQARGSARRRAGPTGRRAAARPLEGASGKA